MGGFTAIPGSLGSDVAYYDPGVPQVIPDTTDLTVKASGSSIIPSGPSLFGDPSGSTAVSTGATNPNPTGGWMNLASSILNFGQKAMTTYVAGSPQTAVPPASRPASFASSSASASSLPGGINWKVVGIAVGAGVVGLVLLAKFA